jgi:competence protein ComEC
MYINGLFLLFFWCLGWGQFGFSNSLYLIIVLLIALLVTYTRRRAALALTVFLLASAGQYDRVYSQFPYPWVSKDLRIHACVSKLNVTRAGISLVLSNAQIDIPIVKHDKRTKTMYGGLSKALNGQVKVTVYPYTKAAQPQLNDASEDSGLAGLIGHTVVLIVRLKGARNFQNPQHYDYLRWSQLAGQTASGYVRQWLSTGELCHGLTWPQLQLEQLRQRLWQSLQSSAELQSMAPQSVGIWGALVLGQTAALTTKQWRVLAATGTTHLLVISGLHVGLVAALAMLLMRLLILPLGISSSLGIRLSAWVGLAVALSFALLSGFGLPAQRAVIMLAGLMWGAMWGLQLSFTQRLFIAFFVTLVLQPLSASNLGFWMSYTAVLALGLVWYRCPSQRWWYRGMQLLAAQGVLSLLLLPVIGLGTGYVSLVGPLVNMILVPVFSVLLIPALLLISVALMLTPLAQFFFRLVDTVLSGLWHGLETLAGFTWSQAFVGWIPLGVFGSVLIVSCICLLIRRWHWPIVMLLMPLIVFTLFKSGNPLIKVPNPSHAEPQVIITLLDVGQGLSIWVRQGEHNMLYDLGNRYTSGFNLVDAVVLPEMLSQGVDQLDVLVISHWDMDHSGGLNTLLLQQTVKRLILPSEVKATREKGLLDYAVKVSRCASTAWQNLWQDNATTLMWRQIALAEYGLSGNDASCVILLNFYGRQVLITGDIEAKAETLLVALAGESDSMSLVSDVLIAPHHGSKTSSTKAFLSHVRPSYVLISAGKTNPYGHPYKKNTAAYWRQGSHWYNTARHGQIQAVFAANGEYKVISYLP